MDTLLLQKFCKPVCYLLTLLFNYMFYDLKFNGKSEFIIMCSNIKKLKVR